MTSTIRCFTNYGAIITTRSNTIPKTPFPAAGEAMPPVKMNRRAVLTGSAVTAAAMAATTVPAATAALPNQPAIAAENPVLASACDAFYAAREHEAAKAALEWLADEYLHLWPLAPEEILGGANAQNGIRDAAERDIAGRFLFRDTAPLTKRLSAEFRLENRKTCFHIKASDKLKERLDGLREFKPKGRTERSLARNIAWRKETIRRLEQEHKLALEYEAETERLREASNVAAFEARIRAAKERMDLAAYDVAIAPVHTVADFRLKAEIIRKHVAALWDGLNLAPGNKLSLPFTALMSALESGEVGQ